MTRQLLIEERFIRCQQVDRAAVLLQLGVQKQLGFRDEGRPQVVVEPGELGAVRIEQPYVAGLQPVFEEIVHQRSTRARIGEQARHLLLQDRGLVQLALDGEIEEGIVGDAAPQEEREARGELDIRNPVDAARRYAGWVELTAEKKIRSEEHTSE